MPVFDSIDEFKKILPGIYGLYPTGFKNLGINVSHPNTYQYGSIEIKKYKHNQGVGYRLTFFPNNSASGSAYDYTSGLIHTLNLWNVQSSPNSFAETYGKNWRKIIFDA